MAHYSLALICNLLNMIEDSIKHYQEAVKIDPNFARAHSNLATVHYSIKQGRKPFIICASPKTVRGAGGTAHGGDGQQPADGMLRGI